MYYRMCHLKIQTVIQFTSLTQDDGVGLKETVKYGYWFAVRSLYESMLQYIGEQSFLKCVTLYIGLRISLPTPWLSLYY